MSFLQESILRTRIRELEAELEAEKRKNDELRAALSRAQKARKW